MKGLAACSWAMVVVGPWPGMTRVSPGKGSRRS